MKALVSLLCVAMAGFACSGCLLRLEHNTLSPGVRGVVLDARTRAPLGGASVTMSRIWDDVLPPIPDLLTNTRPPVVTTRMSGRFCMPAEREWKVVVYLVERFRPGGGTLIVQRAGYEPTTLAIWPDGITKASGNWTNFIVVPLNPTPK